MPTSWLRSCPMLRFIRVPGDHESAFTAPELVAAIAAFLSER